MISVDPSSKRQSILTNLIKKSDHVNAASEVLRKLTKQEEKFNWGPEQERSFEELVALFGPNKTYHT